MFKFLKIPVSNDIKEVRAVQMWEVRWISRYGSYHQDIQKELECFTSEEEAKEFATSLRNAFKLVRNTSEDQVYITKAK